MAKNQNKKSTEKNNVSGNLPMSNFSETIKVHQK
jgi:hypothetical protein